MTKLRYRSLTLLPVVLLLGCTTATQQPAADTRAADEAAIRKADIDWLRVGQSKQVDAWVAFYGPDAVVLPPNDKTAADTASIRKTIGDLLALPGLSLNWQLTKVEVAQSGDIGYGYGTYELTFNDATGKPVTDRGKILEVWKKQADGTWKCIVDTWSSDLPATPAA